VELLPLPKNSTLSSTVKTQSKGENAVEKDTEEDDELAFPEQELASIPVKSSSETDQTATTTDSKATISKSKVRKIQSVSSTPTPVIVSNTPVGPARPPVGPARPPIASSDQPPGIGVPVYTGGSYAYGMFTQAQDLPVDSSKQLERDISNFVEVEVLDVRADELHQSNWTPTQREQAEKMFQVVTSAIKPSALSRRKGQITHLAVEAEQSERLEDERRNAQRLLRKQSAAKYGW